ncbi:MAG TPA: DUF962 domain-containing protein [Planctomycetaceae bacterium]|nr:DUF962 domain-containing protein [Planctomycetaceae bacterium]
MVNFITNYIERHQHPVNQLLHVIGVPMTFIVSLVYAWQGHYDWAAGAFVLGYVLQFVGHAIEGNDAGETILVKKALGLPYVAVIPRQKHVEK